MAAYINRKLDPVVGVGVGPWVQLNRWDNNANYSIDLKLTGAATFSVESTLDYINRAPFTVDVCPIENATDLTASECLNITNTPLEAIRLNITAGTGSVVMHVMQGGTT